MLEVRSLTCERRRRELFGGLSFAARAGEIWQVRGGNGAGKTTLLKILCGLYSDFGGEVLWHTERWPLLVGHRTAVKAQLTCLENLRWLARLHVGRVDDDELVAALARFGLAGYEDVRAGDLSEGQRKRVSLARMILSRAQAWILDEPFSAIDVDGVALIEQLLADHAGHGGLVLMTSHQAPGLGNVRLLDVG